MNPAQPSRSVDIVWLALRCCTIHPDLRRPSPSELHSLQRTIPAAALDDPHLAEAAVNALFKQMHLDAPDWKKQPVSHMLPMVALLPGIGSRLAISHSTDGHWIIEGPDGAERVRNLPANGRYAAIATIPASDTPTTATAIVRAVLKGQRMRFGQAAVASLVANFLALFVALYSMQVYDRVIPTQGTSTLIVLTSGVLIAVLLELVIRTARSRILHAAAIDMDVELSHRIFRQLFRTRLDQFPGSVGTLSSQLRGYETVRTFSTTAVQCLLIDLPFVALFVVIAWAIAGSLLAMIPVIFLLAATAAGFYGSLRVARLAAEGTSASNRRTGLLVEAVEGAETIKAAGAEWRFLSTWNRLARQSIIDDTLIRSFGENTSNITSFFQQSGYITLIAIGAWIASTSGEVTMGAIVACTILSGRMLAPATMVPALVMQWAHARAALANLERVFALESDNHGVARTILPERLHGQLEVRNLKFSYPAQSNGLHIEKLQIEPGEKVGVLGITGCGKSTLLRLLSGLYKPQFGQVLLDGLDIQHISRDTLCQHIGYLAQEVRLVSGTLRDNLTMGLFGKSDQEILDACRRTGLLLLVSSHPKGLDLEISEGGRGVSGGQKQLVALTRLLLAQPSIWMLDEPTAAMDRVSENFSIEALRQSMAPEHTALLVTHKPALLCLVDRIIVVSPEKIIMDGRKDKVLEALNYHAAASIGA